MLQHELIHFVRRSRWPAIYSYGIRGATIDLQVKLSYRFKWLELALVLCFLPFFGLASNECCVEILGEGPSMINADIAPSILALTQFLVQHHYRGISNAVG